MTTHTLTTLTGTIEAQFDEDWAIVKAWYNGKKMKLTPWREWLLWRAFNSKIELERERAEMEWSRRYEYNL